MKYSGNNYRVGHRSILEKNIDVVNGKCNRCAVLTSSYSLMHGSKK
jgi:hypothetical protein